MGQSPPRLHSILTWIHTPGQIVLLGYELLREVPGQVLAPLKMMAEEGGGNVGHAGQHVRLIHHHVVLAYEGDQRLLWRPQVLQDQCVLRVP
jgi:hypothetical protein